MGFAGRLKDVLFDAEEYLINAKDEEMKEPIKYLMFLLPVAATLNFIIWILSYTLTRNKQIDGLIVVSKMAHLTTTQFLLIESIIMFVVFFIATFPMSAISHLFARLFGGRGSFGDSYKAFAYGSTPALLLRAIPLVNIASYLYSIYLQGKWISKFHKIGLAAALAAAAAAYLPLIAAFAAIILL
jgi:hypothetical protein